MDHVLETRDLTVYYNRQRGIVDVNLTVEKGEAARLGSVCVSQTIRSWDLDHLGNANVTGHCPPVSFLTRYFFLLTATILAYIV